MILKDDETKPEIKETKKIKVNAGTEIDYTKYIKVTDDLDPSPNIHYDDSDVDYQTPGTYTLKITATDGNKNKAKKNIKVTIKEPEKIVYLTFDDGPSENTDKVLKILKKNNAKATFFVTGNDQEHNDSIKKAYDAGHTIGLHTYTHDYSKVYSSTSAYFEDLQKISDMVKDITGEESKIIRFPGGSSNQVSAKYCQGIMTQLVDMVHEKGYEYFDWNVASTDAASVTEPTSSIIQSATSGVDNELVILFHDSYPKTTTVEALQTIIDYYKEQGYTFKALKHDSFAAHHEPQN